jgi:phosphoribosylformylglycinamidine cyclo-ligase
MTDAEGTGGEADGGSAGAGDVSDGGEMADDTQAEGLTYADAGVDVEASEAATGALLAAADDAVEQTAYAGLIDIGDRYLGLATDGVGTKLLVARALDDYSTIGIDCVAMNANDLVAAGVEPVAFVDYLAVDAPDDRVAAEIGEGLAAGAERAGVSLLGGETAVMPDVITDLDLAGTCAGTAAMDAVFRGEARPGDALVGWPSSGIHSNGLTLAREAVTRDHAYTDPAPFDPARSLGEVLLEPTRIYTDLLDPMRDAGVRAAAHVTGGGWTNLLRMGDHRFEVDDPFDPQPVFDFVQEAGSVADLEMYRTFNMGTGFVAACHADEAAALAERTDGRVIGSVEAADGDGDAGADADGGTVAVRGLELAEE